MSYDENYSKSLQQQDDIEAFKRAVADKHFSETAGIKNHRKIKSSKGKFPSNRQPAKKKRKK